MRQYLSLFYVTTASVFAAFILRELRLPQKIFYAGILLFMFNPTLFLFSGYISDDTPAMMWSIIAVYFLFRWYKTEKSLYILAAAAGFGFGVLTKLSVLMAVPAIISLFLCKISTSEGKRTDIFPDLRRDRCQHPVSCRVTVSIVDFLEKVDVTHHCCVFCTLSHQHLKHLIAAPAVV